ncbi:MAG TPA: DUF1761 family protein [Pyrinomonadaceae bacterium]|nr:DUF1761 family protein [Pyrinomonadaceae bacterium]
MLTRVLAAAVAGAVAFFLFGFLIYGLVLDPLVMKPAMNPEAAKLMNDPPMWAPLLMSNFVMAFLFAYIFDKWAAIRTFAGGLSAGALIYFLITLGMQLMFMAFMNMSNSLVPMIADVIGSAILGALVGGVVGMVLGMMNKREGSPA